MQSKSGPFVASWTALLSTSKPSTSRPNRSPEPTRSWSKSSVASGQADHGNRTNDPVLRRETGMTKRIEVRRGEKAAILLSTRPAESPALCTSIQLKGKESCSMNAFLGRTAQREPDGVRRFSIPRKKAGSDPSPGTSVMSHACFPGGHSRTHSTRGPKISRQVRRNSAEEPRAYAGSSPGSENLAQGV